MKSSENHTQLVSPLSQITRACDDEDLNPCQRVDSGGNEAAVNSDKRGKLPICISCTRKISTDSAELHVCQKDAQKCAVFLHYDRSPILK